MATKEIHPEISFLMQHIYCLDRNLTIPHFHFILFLIQGNFIFKLFLKVSFSVFHAKGTCLGIADTLKNITVINEDILNITRNA